MIFSTRRVLRNGGYIHNTCFVHGGWNPRVIFVSWESGIEKTPEMEDGYYDTYTPQMVPNYRVSIHHPTSFYLACLLCPDLSEKKCPKNSRWNCDQQMLISI